MSAEYLEDAALEPEDLYLDEADITAILQEYHRRRMLENLVGPGTSLMLHVVLLAVLFAVVTREVSEPEKTVTVTMTKEKIIEIEPEVRKHIDQEIEEVKVDTPSPTPAEVPTDTQGATMDSPVDVSDELAQTDDNMMTEVALDIEVTNSPYVLTDLYGGRSDQGRAGKARKYNGSPRGLPVVRKSLTWLANVQNEDGSWGTKHKAAHTGMAALVFLGHGETPLSKDYGDTVQRALNWLREYGLGRPDKRAYSHGIATYALCEAYGMTRIPMLRSPMEQALQRILDGQQARGGFDYHYKKGKRWDMSVSGWQFQALKAGYVAGASNEGLEEAIRESLGFLRHAAYGGPGFGYASKPGTRPNLTGAGAVSMQLLGEGDRNEVATAVNYVGTKRLAQYRKVMNDPDAWGKVASKCMYGWYYDTQAIFNAQGTPKGKALWDAWQPAFEKVLMDAQHHEGYWEAPKGHGMGPSLNGRILCTCWAALQLEVYYRYLPTFNIKEMDKHRVEAAGIGHEGAGDGDLIMNIQ